MHVSNLLPTAARLRSERSARNTATATPAAASIIDPEACQSQKSSEAGDSTTNLGCPNAGHRTMESPSVGSPPMAPTGCGRVRVAVTEHVSSCAEMG